MAFRGSGANAFKWWSMRPPVAMPLAETMIIGPGLSLSAFEVSASLTHCATRARHRAHAAKKGQVHFSTPWIRMVIEPIPGSTQDIPDGISRRGSAEIARPESNAYGRETTALRS
jgi:hypothetical protein